MVVVVIFVKVQVMIGVDDIFFFMKFQGQWYFVVWVDVVGDYYLVFNMIDNQLFVQ